MKMFTGAIASFAENVGRILFLDVGNKGLLIMSKSEKPLDAGAAKKKMQVVGKVELL